MHSSNALKQIGYKRHFIRGKEIAEEGVPKLT